MENGNQLRLDVKPFLISKKMMFEKEIIMKRILKKFFTIILTLGMLFGNFQQVYAWDASIPHEFTKVKSIDYPWWWSAKIGSVRQWSTTMYTYNGNIAYCLEASKNTPVSGSYVASVIDDHPAVKKLLYYGYGGPGYDQKIEAVFEQQLKACVPDDFGKDHGNFEDGAYLFTHIWLSYAYCGDLMGLSLDEFNAKWPNPDGNGGYGDNIMWGYQAINALPEPDYAQFEVNGQQSSTAQLKASFDKENKVQRTETVTFTGSSNATAHITLQDQVTLHNVTAGTTQTGGTATVYGGQKFYLSAPLNNCPEDYVSGNIAGEHCERFEALAIIPGGNYQSEGSWVKDAASLYYGVNWMELGSLRLSKVDNTSAFQKGAKFRLVSTSYDGFDETYEVSKDKDGDYELLIEGLPVGTYALTEIDCDDSFAPTVAQWSVTIEKNKTTKQVVVNTLRPTGNLTVQKTLESANAGATDVADADITKTKYQVVASDDIKDTVSLKDLYKKGEAITVGSGQCIVDASGQELEFSKGVHLVKGTDNGDGTFSVDKDGKLELSGIPLGKYKVIETDCANGYVLNETDHEVKFVQQDYTTKIYQQNVEVTNMITKTQFLKTDITGEKELAGASLKITDQSGQVVDEWISSDQPHEIDGLTAGKTYTLHEDLAPLGYVKAASVDFTVNQDGQIQKVMMKDSLVSVQKTDENNQLLKGAILEVVSRKTKNIVDRWTTGQHIIDIDESMKMSLLHHETITGTVTKDGSEITYSISDHDGDYFVMMKDKDEVSYYLVDIEGNETVHMVQGLAVGEEYILREIEAPRGYATAKEQTFTVNGKKDIRLTMVDRITKIDILKVDASTEKPLAGAQLTLMDKATGEIIETWMSETKAYRIEGLEAGKTYVLHEERSPEGYQKANDIEFIVQDSYDIQKIVMKDESIPVIVKTGDESGLMGYAFMGLSSMIICLGYIYFWMKKSR